MNRGQLRGALKERLRLAREGDPRLSDDALNDCIRLALDDLSGEHEWPWLVTSASLAFSTSTGKASWPADCFQLKELEIGGVRAKRAGLAEWIDAGPAGRYVWNEQGGSIALSPNPSTVPTAVLFYVRQEPILSVDTASPLVPAVYHPTVIARASYHANTRRRFGDDAAFDGTEYEGAVRRMRRAMQAKTGARTVRTAGRFEQWATW